MTGEQDNTGVTLAVDPEVSKFLESFESIKTEVGELKSFKETIEVKQDDLGNKLDTMFESFSKFIESFQEKEKDNTEDKKQDIKSIPERKTLVEGRGSPLSIDDAVDAGLRAIAISSLDPDVKQIHLMSDLTGRYAYKPRPDPNARAHNLRLAEEY